MLRLQSMKCGRRGCPSCRAYIAANARERIKGSWGTLVTLTIGSHRGLDSVREWEAMPRRVTRWMAAFRERLRRQRPGITRKDPEAQYAWVLEDHASGFPHVHIALGLHLTKGSDEWWGWIRWGRAAWNRIVGRVVLQQQWEVVRDSTKTRDYLCKYMIKQGMPVWVYAAMYRQRLWAASKKAPDPDPPKGWTLTGYMSHKEALGVWGNLENLGRDEGWRLDFGSDESSVVQWSRDMRLPSPLGPDDGMSIDGPPDDWLSSLQRSPPGKLTRETLWL